MEKRFSTPPWEYKPDCMPTSEDVVIDSKGGWVCILEPLAGDEPMYNGRLIAASPLMLKALEDAQELITRKHGHESGEWFELNQQLLMVIKQAYGDS